MLTTVLDVDNVMLVACKRKLVTVPNEH